MLRKPIPQYRALNFLCMLYIMTIVASTVLFQKFVSMGPFLMAAGSMIYPFTYYIQILIAEVYGYEIVKKTIWSAIIIATLFCIITSIMIHLPSPLRSDNTKAFEQLLALDFRFVFAGVVTTIASSFICAYVFSKLKILLYGKRFWFRTLLALFFGQLIDSFLIMFFAFVGIYPLTEIILLALSIFIFKTLLSLILLIPAQFVSKVLKLLENSDVIDDGVNLNPFKW